MVIGPGDLDRRHVTDMFFLEERIQDPQDQNFAPCVVLDGSESVLSVPRRSIVSLTKL